MNLQQFSRLLEQYAPDGFAYWAGHNKSSYNTEKTISDTLLVVLPNPFPVQWRDRCWHTVTMQLWFGKVVDVKTISIGEQQHDPYNPIELRDGLYMIAADYIAQINSNDYIQVQQEIVQGTYYDSPDGQSVNRQVWLQVPLTLKVYQPEGGFDYFFDVTF